MTCPQHDQTLLWLYGESADEAAIERHLVDCADCQALVAEHEEVASAVDPVSAALGTARPAPAPPHPANHPLRWVGVVLVAATALVAVLAWPRPEPAAPSDTDLAVLDVQPGSSVVEPPLFNELDAELEALDLELAELRNDLHTL